MSIFKKLEFIFELWGWFRIFLSVFVAGCGIGAIIYYNVNNTLGLCIAIFVAVLGFVFGIIWATRAWKKGGTMHTLSRTMASPELDNQEGEDKKD